MSDKGIETVEKKFRVTATLTSDDCPWFKDDDFLIDGALPRDTIVYQYFGYTYGCISPSGIAVTKENGKTPFLEVPRRYLEAVA